MNLIDRRGQYEPNGDWYERLQNKITKITVHHSADWQDEASDDAVLKNLMNAHIKNGWPGLSYHIVYIPKSGNFYWINDFTKVTWHDTVNWDSIGVLIHGYYHKGTNGEKAEVPTKPTLAALKEVLDWLCTENPDFPAGEDDVIGHRERYATACCGDTLFPYVTDYRTKLGNVDWGAGEVEDPEPQPGLCMALDDDIPTEVEDKYSLKKKPGYNNKMTLGEFIEYCLSLIQDEMALRAYLQFLNSKLTGLPAVTPKPLKDEQNDLTFQVDLAVQKIKTGLNPDITAFPTEVIRDEFINRVLDGILGIFRKKSSNPTP